jgi:purine-binding chemotaxis protein CheW
MNLAEIRKKAMKEKVAPKEDAAPVAMAVEDVAEVPESFLPEALPPLQEETVEDESHVEALTPEFPGLLESPKKFDPFAVLQQGRKNAQEDEEKSLFAAAREDAYGTQLLEFLCFRVASETYALNIMEIKEIIKPREVTEVPRVPEFVSGVLSLRGIIIPVFQMRHRLGLPAAGMSGKERIVVVKQGEGFCGLFVDEVIQVVKIGLEGIENPPAVLDGIDRDFVQGIGRHEGRMLILLNLEKILDVSFS